MTARDERVLPPVLLGLTAVTGLVDTVSYLALGHVFTANMTGNVVFLGFAWWAPRDSPWRDRQRRLLPSSRGR
jgi:uncharacterized membrane protein YoaK (UPF0700 family)